MVARHKFAGCTMGLAVWIFRSTIMIPPGNVETYINLASGESVIPFANSNRPGSLTRSVDPFARYHTAPAGVSVRYTSPLGAMAKSLKVWPAPVTLYLLTSRRDATW